MQTEIKKSYSNKQIKAELKRFSAKYISLENLYQKFSVDKCVHPEYVDDYMVWKALEEGGEDITIKEKIILKNLDIYQMFSPKRMEIVDYLSTNSTKSIKTLALELKRNYKNVYDDIKALRNFELIELFDDGRNKRPVTNIESIIVTPDKKIGP